MNNWKVYCHTFPNGKKYVGITGQSPELRWGTQGSNYRGQKVYQAIKKYGWDNVSHTILKENLTEEQACYYEQLYIKSLDSHISKNGYNCSWGGEGSTKYSHETIYKKWISGMSIKAIAEQEGCNVCTVSRILESYGVSHEECYNRANAAQSKKVNQYTIDGKYIATYQSTRAAAEAMGISPKRSNEISIGCNDSNAIRLGYRWRWYVGDISDLPNDELKKYDGSAEARRVGKYDRDGKLLMMFESLTEAAATIEASSARKSIAACCRGDRKTSYGFIWKFI